MSLASEETIGSLNIYEEIMNEESVLDFSGQELNEVPEIYDTNVLSLYLQNNNIVSLPDDLFPTLQYLMWLDLRDNRLTDLPKAICHHQCLTHLLLQNNCLTSLPNELGTVRTLKVLQLQGNPLMYPPSEVINGGVKKILNFLYDKFVDENTVVANSQDVNEETASVSTSIKQNGDSKDSNLEQNENASNITVDVHEKGTGDGSEENTELYPKLKGKCRKLDESRHKNVSIPSYYQSAKYLNPLKPDSRLDLVQKMKQSYLRDMAMKKHKDLLELRDKILQDTKNLEFLRNWRQSYRLRQCSVDPRHRLDAASYPYDTDPQYMTLLSRQDIEKDLPDKYRKNLVRRSRTSVPRKSDDVVLARRIKQLFDNLEAIDITTGGMSPRTEQRMLLHEINKISEIKNKLMELSSTNMRSVSND